MKKDVLAAVLFTVLLMFVMVGCRPKVMDDANQSIQKAAIAVEPIGLYYVAGVALLVIGGGMIALRARTTGATLMAVGIGTAWFGQTLLRYPWVSLMAVLLASAAAAVLAYLHWKDRRELQKTKEAVTAIAGVIESVPEGRAIKGGIANLGAEVAAKVKSVVTPIKERLFIEGSQ